MIYLDEFILGISVNCTVDAACVAYFNRSVVDESLIFMKQLLISSLCYSEISIVVDAYWYLRATRKEVASFKGSLKIPDSQK